MHGPCHARIGRALRLALLLGLCSLLTACQVWERIQPADDPGSSLPDSQPSSDTSGERGAPRGLPPATLQQVINDLDTGRLDQAETALLSIIDQRPNSRLALRFLEQLQSDPIELMGSEYDVVTVQPGDSLSSIAARELGDAMQFFALARYNQIRVPRRMSSGIDIRIPRSLQSAEAAMPEPVEPALMPEPSLDEPSAAPGAGLAVAGRRLLQSGRTQQTISLLLAGARAGNLDRDGEQVLVDATLVRSGELVEEDELERAVEMLDDVQASLSPAARPQLAAGRDAIEAQRLMAEGIRERRAGRLEEAMGLFQQAMQLDPDNETLRSQAATLSEVLIARLHHQALVHYRDQQLEDAIILWQQVVELDPEFEPARVYLDRSRALKEKLEELE